MNDYTAQEIAEQLDRLHADTEHVDRARSGNGHQSAGYSGDDANEPPTIGWYCEGGNVGHVIAAIPLDEIDDVYNRVASATPGDGTAEAVIRQYQ